MSAQYSLPCKELGALRDFDGVRRCVLDAANRAQGKGCAPGILGVCIGGDRASGYHLAKEQLFRKLPDINPEPALAKLEEDICSQANRLGIGPMGLRGNTTVLGVKAIAAGRHPASYFVTVSYSCWATRRYGVELDEGGGIARWL
jgi:fumarate hydratase class I